VERKKEYSKSAYGGEKKMTKASRPCQKEIRNNSIQGRWRRQKIIGGGGKRRPSTSKKPKKGGEKASHALAGESGNAPASRQKHSEREKRIMSGEREEKGKKRNERKSGAQNSDM